MKKWDVVPCKSIGNIEFAQKRERVRAVIGLSYREMKKSIFAKNTMDVYEGFHVYYDQSNGMNAIEFFDGVTVTIKGKKIFPGKIANALKMIPDLEEDAEGYISYKDSIGMTVSSDNPEIIESILIGCAKYYE